MNQEARLPGATGDPTSAVERRQWRQDDFAAGKEALPECRGACSRLRATTLQGHFFAFGEVAPLSLSALPKAGAYVQGWTVVGQCRSNCRGKQDSFEFLIMGK